MKTFAKIILKIINSLSIMDFLNKKIWTCQLARLLRNSKIHIEFHSTLLIGTKNELMNVMIKLSVKSFLKNLYQMVVMTF
jgi:hypothetical protein